jgi:hypothetical protein
MEIWRILNGIIGKMEDFNDFKRNMVEFKWI